MENKASKTEIREIAEVLEILNQFPLTERIAIKYYLKGRLDAIAGNLEIPTPKAAS